MMLGVNPRAVTSVSAIGETEDDFQTGDQIKHLGVALQWESISQRVRRRLNNRCDLEFGVRRSSH